MPHGLNAELPKARRVDWDSLRVNTRSAAGEEPGLFSLVFVVFFYFFLLLSFLPLPNLACCPANSLHLTLGPSVSPFLSFCHVSSAACRHTQHPRPVLTLVQRSSLCRLAFFSFDSTSLHARSAPFSRSFQLTLRKQHA